MKTNQEKTGASKISRKDALKKAGMYAAFTAAASMVLLTPKAMAAGSQAPNPGWGANNAPASGGGSKQSSPFNKDQSSGRGDRSSPWK